MPQSKTAFLIDMDGVIYRGEPALARRRTKSVSMDMLERAVTFIDDGARLITRNLDPNCPPERGMREARSAFAEAAV